MQTVSTFSKLMIGFVMGAVVAGGVAVAVTPDLPPTKVCVDNRTKALFAATDGKHVFADWANPMKLAAF